MGIYDAADLRKAVRATMQNVSQVSLSDDSLNVILEQGKRRLDRDVPRTRTSTITGGASPRWFNITENVSDWIEGFSIIRELGYPAPDVPENTIGLAADIDSYFVKEIDGITYLSHTPGIQTGDSALIRYTTRWDIKDIAGATKTTLPESKYNAIEFICISLTCLSMATKYAGTSDNQLELGGINFRTKEAEYRRMAKEYEARYLDELGLGGNNVVGGGPKAAGIMARRNYDLGRNRTHLTHYRGSLY